MQIQIVPVQKPRSGFALLTTLIFLAILLISFVSIMYLVSSNATVTSRNNIFNMSQAAAEGATEMVIAQMNQDFLNQSLNDTNYYETLVTNLTQTGWPVQFQISDTNGVVNRIYVSEYPQAWKDQQTNIIKLTDPQFVNLYGAVADCTIIACATPLNQVFSVPATICQKLYMASIPVFQFGVFYNMDMDLSNGKPMTMNGKTFVNGNIWMYPQNSMTFNDTVSATLLVTNHDNPSDQQNLTSYTAPTYNFTANGGKALSLAAPVSLPLAGLNSSPTNIEAILNLPPAGLGAPQPAAYISSNQMYLYNVCDLIVSNASTGINPTTGTNFIIYYQDPSSGSAFTKLTNEVFTFRGPGTNTTTYTTNSPYPWNTNYTKVAAGFSWLTNVTFYDYRESASVKAVQIDVSQFNIWLTNQGSQGPKFNSQCGGTDGISGDKGHPLDSIYVYNNIQQLTGQLPAVRVVNGTTLPSQKGLSVITPFPLYVLGNYNIQTNTGATSAQKSYLMTNTAWAWPAGLMGDSVTILSAAWKDSNSTNRLQAATNTTVNAACLEGIVPSTTVASGPLAGKHYSGGLENFLRLLEDWSNETICYNGSIIVMFPSMYATNFWVGPGTASPSYYNVPTRMWGFDANFTGPAGQPPASPAIKAMIRHGWLEQSQ